MERVYGESMRTVLLLRLCGVGVALVLLLPLLFLVARLLAWSTWAAWLGAASTDAPVVAFATLFVSVQFGIAAARHWALEGEEDWLWRRPQLGLCASWRRFHRTPLPRGRHLACLGASCVPVS
jgi:hypothetical protein